MKAKKSEEAGKPKFAKVSGNALEKFEIELEFDGNIIDSQKAAVTKARDRWLQVIVRGVPRAEVDGKEIDGLLIVVEANEIEGPDNPDARTDPASLVMREPGIGRAEFLPAKAVITFDPRGLKRLEKKPLSESEKKQLLYQTALHEIGHALGIGTVWRDKKLLQGLDTKNPTFHGTGAMKAYGDLLGSGPTPVPVENEGDDDFTNFCHWRESVFDAELMTAFDQPFSLLSLMTIMSLGDLGYTVNPKAADIYGLPTA